MTALVPSAIKSRGLTCGAMWFDLVYRIGLTSMEWHGRLEFDGNFMEIPR